MDEKFEGSISRLKKRVPHARELVARAGGMVSMFLEYTNTGRVGPRIKDLESVQVFLIEQNGCNVKRLMAVKPDLKARFAVT